MIIFKFLSLWSLEKGSQCEGIKITKNNEERLDKNKNNCRIKKKVGEEKKVEMVYHHLK